MKNQIYFILAHSIEILKRCVNLSLKSLKTCSNYSNSVNKIIGDLLKRLKEIKESKEEDYLFFNIIEK